MSSDKSSRLIPTFDYLRKSTKGETIDRRTGRATERQEKSIEQQRKELDVLRFPDDLVRAGFTGYQIAGTFADEGVSGWKLGPKRPGFQSMIEAIKKHPAKEKVIRVDNMDRFSRADIDETQETARELKKAGVKWIVSAAQGVFHIGRSGNDLVEVMRFAFSASASHEYSRQLSRRVSLARRNQAKDGIRPGGLVAYGMEGDGKGGLKPSNDEKTEIVRWLFDQFGNQGRSVNWLAGDLNRRGIPSPEGNTWWTGTILPLLKRRCYRGDFIFNKEHAGQFFCIDERGEVVEKTEDIGPGKLFEKEGAYEPVVDGALFDKVQRRFERLKKDRTQRKRMGYALTGILVCDHCGKRMHGTRQIYGKPGERRYTPTVYRCGTPADKGAGACRQYSVREDRVLPFILETLVREMADLKSLIITLEGTSPIGPRKEQVAERKRLEKERDRIAKRINITREAIFDMSDPRDRQELDKRLVAMRQELDGLDAALSVEAQDGPSAAEFKAIEERMTEWMAWMSEFQETAVEVPVPAKVQRETIEQRRGKKFGKEDSVRMEYALGNGTLASDPRKVNEALTQLGCEVRLRWETRQQGKRQRHELVQGRFRLGQQKGPLPLYVLEEEKVLEIRTTGRWRSSSGVFWRRWGRRRSRG